jgi:hypothetical protein
MYASSIILAKDLDLSKVTYDEPRKLDNGGKMIYVSFKRQPIRIQTPSCYVPFGINVYKNEDSNTESHSIDLSFDGKDHNPAMKDFYDKIRKFDEMNVEKGFEYHQSWFRKKFQSKDVIEALYTTMIKYPKDRNGDITTDWPPTFKFKLPMDKSGEYKFEVYDSNNNTIDIREITTKGARMTAILKCNGIWLAGGKFGMSWKVEQLLVQPPTKLTGFCIKFIEDERIEYVCDVNSVGSGDVDDGDDDEDADENPDVNDNNTTIEGERPISANDDNYIDDSDTDSDDENNDNDIKTNTNSNTKNPINKDNNVSVASSPYQSIVPDPEAGPVSEHDSMNSTTPTVKPGTKTDASEKQTKKRVVRKKTVAK